jgi:hypothetical protein
VIGLVGTLAWNNALAGTPPPPPPPPPETTADDPGNTIISGDTLTGFSKGGAPNVIGGNVGNLQFGSGGAGGLGGATGKAAGDGSGQWGVWANYTHSNIENDLSSTAFDGDLNAGLASIYTTRWKNFIVGLAAGYENMDSDTTFNAGEQETSGWTVAPYLGYLISPMFSVDVNFGYAGLETDQFRTAAGARVTSSFDSERWFASGSLNANKVIDKWILGGRLTYLWTVEDQDGFTESNGTGVRGRKVRLSQLQVGGDVGYSFGEFEPYVTAAFSHDVSRSALAAVPGGLPQPSDDDNDFQLGLGVRYFGKQGISGVLEWTTVTGRDNYDDDTINLTIGTEF